ncbi:MAG: tagaturonate reductase [Clostridia bacterium]|nr:tagaturonate reductase [Clostridia bacterium]
MNITDLASTARPVRIIQFGGGVFLRGFFDWMLAKANAAGVMDASAVIVRARTGGEDPLSAQRFRYTHAARDGSHNDITLVDCIAGSLNPADDWEAYLSLADNPDASVIVSNTTESGIVYTPCPTPAHGVPESFPARLTALLHRRFLHKLPGFLILPCELIDTNGDTLRELVLRHAADWSLGEDFARFVTNECSFRNTLVDRIVSGKPGEGDSIDLPYEDTLVNTSEYFHLWVIDGEEDERLPFAKIGLNVRWVPDINPYRTLKVRILNGAHTSMIPYALLRGVETVGECMSDSILRGHLEACLFEEIIPSLDSDPAEAEAYAKDVLERFSNPYIHHLCRSIALNSLDKFRVRVLPSILAYQAKTGRRPSHLLFSLAMLIRLYKDGTPNDTDEKIAYMRSTSVRDILANAALWGSDLSEYAEEVEHDTHTSL